MKMLDYDAEFQVTANKGEMCVSLPTVDVTVYLYQHLLKSLQYLPFET